MKSGTSTTSAVSTFTEEDVLKKYENLGSAFVKTRTHFNSVEEKFLIPGTEKLTSPEKVYHFASLLKKNHKENSSPDHDDAEWIKVDNHTFKDHERLCALITAAGEIYRFEIGATQPKYRYEREEGKIYPISKKIKSGMEFFSIFSENEIKVLLQKKNKTVERYDNTSQFYEGMGRVIFNKYLYLEDDLHFGNAFIDPKRYFVGIDHDRTFGPVAYNLHNPAAYRRVYSRFDAHDFNTDDYDHLPLISHYADNAVCPEECQPTNWKFDSASAERYSKRLSKDELFCNEKHFSALKSLITPFMKKLLINIHINHAEDKKNLLELIDARLANLYFTCRASKSFKTYLADHRLDAMKTVLYELNEFFKENKHYLLKDAQEQQGIWNFITHQAIEKFSELLLAIEWDESDEFSAFCSSDTSDKFENFQLTDPEMQALEVYAEAVKNNDQQTISDAATFYKQQKMDYCAKNARKKLAVHKEMKPEISPRVKSSI